MPSVIVGKRIVLGVTGSIAAYKAAYLASLLTQEGAQVDVILSRGAAQFVTSLTFRSLTHRPVLTDLFDVESEMAVEHVALANAADLVVIAPATAHAIARLALGLADDVVTTTALATQAPIIVAPAMDGHMYDNAATQENLEKLRQRGVVVVGPAAGRLASGLTGWGRLVEPEEIGEYARMVLGRKGDLMGRSVVVTAGGTQEPLDPVRVLTNRSSGKMGFALAQAARDRGARVTLVTAPTELGDPVGVTVVRVTTALEMRDAVYEGCRGAHALIMAAAVADYRPASTAPQKVKKGAERWSVELVKTPDILGGAPEHLVKVGFAAESEDVIKHAREKLQAKHLDLIVANNITEPQSGFGSENNRVTMLDKNGGVEELPLLPKYEVAWRVLDRVAALLK